MSAVDLVAARLEVVVPQRAVYRHALPNDPADLAAQYLWVYGNVPSPQSIDLGDSQSLRDQTVWITSAARDSDVERAANVAVWAADKAQEALIGWRPAAGHWKPVPLSSQPPQRDNDETTGTVVFTVATWGFTYQP